MKSRKENSVDIFDKCHKFTRAKEAIAAGIYPYFQQIQSGPGSEVIINGKSMIMIGSNNYLGLTGHPKVIEAGISAIRKYGTGCTGSRFLNGTLDIHEELEKRLARFLNREAVLCFSTGHHVNQGCISTLVGKKDIVFTDRADHASIVDGTRLTFGKIVKYKHNDMEDLCRALKHYENHSAGKMIVTDGVFSMEGDIVNLPGLVKLANQFNARVYVDDAHSVGVLGKHGRGTGEHFGLEDQIDLQMGTFSKSFASLGGFVAGDEDVIHYIKHHARSLIFTASAPPASVATVLAALDIIESEPERIEQLRKITQKMKRGYDSLGFDTGKSETPIIPIKIGKEEDCLMFWKLLFDNGIFANPSISPAVPPGEAIIRTSYMATHTEDELNQILEIFARLGKQFGIIP
ncbi:MAG TPA: pyridoxal phosphate-dependent aminotransferase family protein [bacterium]|nr:pyridoxal phosphate-dependent aminotransferase family protein [bacterium]